MLKLLYLATIALCLFSINSQNAFSLAQDNASDTAHGGTSIPPTLAYNSPDFEDMLIEKLRGKRLPFLFNSSFVVANPQGEFKDVLRRLGNNSVGYGFNFSMGYYFDPVPIALSLDGGALFFGGEERKDILKVGNHHSRYDMGYQNAIFPFGASIRLQPNIASYFFPYAEAFGGFSWYHSRASKTRHFFESEESESDSRSSFVWNYGLGVGSAFRIADFVNLPNNLVRLLLDVRCRYIYSGSMTVYRSELTPENTWRFLQADVPASDLVHFSIGFSIHL